MAENRGGPRQGVPGRRYPERTDIQMGARKPSMPTVAPAGNQPRGAQAQQLRSLQALPLAPATAAPAGSVGGPNGTGAAPPPPPPFGSINAPTMRPDEPVTAGVNVGPGPGAAPMSVLTNPSPLLAAAAALSSISDDDMDVDTRRLLDLIQAQLGNASAV